MDIHVQKNEAGTLHFKAHMKINSKWVKGLNVRAKTSNFLEKYIAVHF